MFYIIGQNLVSKSPHEMEETKSWYGRQFAYGPAPSGWEFPLRTLPWGTSLLPRGTVPLYGAGSLRAVFPSFGGQPPSYAQQPGALPHVIMATPWVPGI